MRVAVCDDEALFRTQIVEIIKEYTEQSQRYDVGVTVFERGEDLMDAVSQMGGFDIYILDILMPEVNGIELGIWLRNNGFDGKIIYLTFSKEYAVDSYRAKAFDYIVKPVEKDRFLAAFDEAITVISRKKDKKLLVKTRENSIMLNFDSILYAQRSGRAVIYHLTNGRTVESVSIRTTFPEAMQELLRDSRFVLCGASMVANLYHITMIENDALVFRDTHKAYLGIKACRELRSVWYDFWFNGEGSK